MFVKIGVDKLKFIMANVLGTWAVSKRGSIRYSIVLDKR